MVSREEKHYNSLKPCAVIFLGEEYKVSSWEEVSNTLNEVLNERYPDTFASKIDKNEKFNSNLRTDENLKLLHKKIALFEHKSRDLVIEVC